MPALHPDKKRSVRLAVDANYRRRQAAKNKAKKQAVLPMGDSLSLVDRMAYQLHEPGFRSYFKNGASNG